MSLLAEIGIPILSFATGSALPFLYNKFSYDGISIRLHVYAVGAVYWRDEPYLLHSVVVKILNVTANPIVLETVDIRDFRSSSETRFQLSSLDFGHLTETLEAYIPNNEAPPENQLALPIAVQANTEFHLTFESMWRYSVRQPNGSWENQPADVGVPSFHNRINDKGLNYRIRINGKYRRYNYALGTGNTISGYRYIGSIVSSDEHDNVGLGESPGSEEANNPTLSG